MSLDERRIWMDGELRPWADATVHVLSQSLQRGTLVFDVMPVYPGPRILGLREHTVRFQRSARLNGMELAHDLDALLGGVAEAVRANPGCDLVKLSAYYPGVSLDVLPRDARATVAIAAFAGAEVSPGWGPPREPARLQLAEPRKLPGSVLSPQLKIAAGYTAAALAKAVARDAGFHDILFLDGRGDLTESSTQSFFAVADGELRTAPPDLVLEGITRRAVIELAVSEGLPVRVGSLPRDLLESADEAFLTGTTSNLWPVGQIDDRSLPDPVPGKLTALLLRRFERMLAGDDAEFSPRWMQELPG